jgi:hypothetical protein
MEVPLADIEIASLTPDAIKHSLQPYNTPLEPSRATSRVMWRTQHIGYEGAIMPGGISPDQDAARLNRSRVGTPVEQALHLTGVELNTETLVGRPEQQLTHCPAPGA